MIHCSSCIYLDRFRSNLFDLLTLLSTECLSMNITGTDVSVSWFKDGKPLKTGDGITISRDEDVFKIQVARCSSESAGEYTCTASNAAGSACCTANVIVTGWFFFCLVS
jgi:hypothetical protein